MAAQRQALPRERAAAAGEALAAGLAELRELRAARRIALYAAAGGEMPTAPLLRLALGRGLAVLWPRLAGGSLEFAACSAAALVRGAFGVAEPPRALPAEALGPGDLVVLPALALDAAGRRLGRGGGHYDRAFAGVGADGPFRVGVGYDFQLVDEVPADVEDGRVDMVATETRQLRTASA
jgi:5-formyltetrahydrofolate cyclo-ligase